jgi:hypothetical protein
MAQTLYLLPVPSTALLHGEKFHVLPGRTCALTCEYENDNDEPVSLKMFFEGVEAFKCTYYKACPVELIKAAYDKVVDLGASVWFSEITERLSGDVIDLPELHHLVIYFDDGPCYEFICKEFRAEKG